MPRVDIKAIIKDLNKDELKDLISVAQGVLSGLFSSDEIKDNIKESRFSKGYECPKCQCKDVNKNGNLALAGHNNYDGTMFGKNKQLVIGDKIYLTDLQKNTVEYEIKSIFKTDPNDVSILETQDKEKKELTLITCTNGNKERLIIKAEEVKK